MKIGSLIINKYFLHLTEKCNLKCPHCFNQAMPVELDLKTISNLLSRMDKYGISEICLSGGEPLLHSSFEDVIRIIPSNVKISIFTNGVLLNDKHIYAKLENINNLQYIQVSLDGLETNTQIRGVGYDTILQAIKKIKQLGYRCIVSTSCTKNNLKELGDLYKELVKLNVEMWRLSIPFPFAGKMLDYMDMSFDAIMYGFSEVIEMKMRNQYKTNVFISNIVSTEHLNSIRGGNINLMKLSQHFSDIHPCVNCAKSINIKANYNVAKCDIMSDFILYNIQNDTNGLDNIFDEKAEASKKLLYFSNIKLNKICLDCKYLIVCHGGCPGNSYRWLGDMTIPDPISCNLMYRSKELFSLLGYNSFILNDRNNPYYNDRTTTDIYQRKL